MTLREIYTYISSGKLQKFCKYKFIADINIRLKEQPVINSSPRYIYHLVYDNLLSKLRLEMSRLYITNDIDTLFSGSYEIQLIDRDGKVFYIKDFTQEEQK